MNDKKMEDRYKTRVKKVGSQSGTSQRRGSGPSRYTSGSSSSRHYVSLSREREYERRRRKGRAGCLVSIGLLILVMAALYILIFHSPVFDRKDANAQSNPTPTFTEYIASTPTPTLKPDATNIPTPTPEPVSTLGYITTDDVDGIVRLRREPDGAAVVIGELHNREMLYVVGKEGDYYKIKYGGEYGYVFDKYVEEGWPDDDMVCDIISDELMYSRLVEVTDIIPDLMIEMPYATESNHVNRQMYPFELALLQESTAFKLKEAQDMFMEDGYCIVFWDGYRPHSVTKQTFAIIQDSKLAADPSRGSNHNRGAAVDITLYDLNKNEYVNMPTEVREMDYDLAKRSSPFMTAEQKANMEYMERIMAKAGFSPYAGEWWHYNDSDLANNDFPVMDVLFEAWVGNE